MMIPAKKLIKKINIVLIYVISIFVIIILLNAFIFQVTTVSGESMMQTLHNHDIYFTLKTDSTLKKYPNYEDIVIIDSRVSEKRTFLTEITDIFRHNLIKKIITGEQPHDYWVKRVIGLPGDKIRLEDGIVYRNETILREPYVNPGETPYYSSYEITVPEGHIFVMGDNRNHSSDSRIIGAIPVENVIGTIKFKIKSGK